jgi:GNAT superfamily N-acetyltransferase
MNAMNVVIRPAIPQDCTGLFDLIAAHARFEQSMATLSPSDLLTLLARDAAPVTIFVGERAGQLLGFAALTFDFALWRARRWAHLDCLFVRDDARKLGIGSKLMDTAVDCARKAGADRLEWQTPPWNEDAIAFYRRIGAESSAKVRFTLKLPSEA